jgi:ubiquinone/menaquinone biosynthesis C-methylase UbiE
VGCGEGLIGFGALERGAGHVIFSDISEALLEVCRAAAVQLGVEDRCTFVQARAETWRRSRRGALDVVATRSVLIYVKDKRPRVRGVLAPSCDPGACRRVGADQQLRYG